MAVGLPTSIAAILAAPLFERLAQEHPGVRLQLSESFSGYLVELLANGRLDIVVLFRETETPEISVRLLFAEHLSVFGVPHVGNPEADTCELSLLAGVPLVLPGPANGLRSHIERAFAQARVEINVVADIDALPVMLDLARNGSAGMINSGGVARVAQPPILARRLIEPAIIRPVCLCVPTATPQTAASLAAEETMRTLVRERGAMWDKVA